MGYQDRDYSRDSLEPPSYVKIPHLAPIYWLLIVCVLASIIEADEKLAILTNISFQSIFINGHLWAIFLSPFAPDFYHTTIGHCLALFFIGRRNIPIDGLLEFLSVYVVSAIVGMIFYWVSLRLSPNFEIIRHLNLDAATWALCGVGMVYAVRYPSETILLFFVLPIQVKLLMAGIVIIVLLSMASSQSPIAEYIPLLASLGFGYLIAFKRIRLTTLGSKLKRYFGKVSLPITGNSVNIKTMSEEEIKKEIDRLLDKITEKGAISLTSKERDFLMKSSKRHQ